MAAYVSIAQILAAGARAKFSFNRNLSEFEFFRETYLKVDIIVIKYDFNIEKDAGLSVVIVIYKDFKTASVFYLVDLGEYYCKVSFYNK